MTSEKERRLRVGVLCYSLMSATTDFLNRIADSSRFDLKAFPLVMTKLQVEPRFEYRATTFRGRFVRFTNTRRDAPEVQIAALCFRTVRALVAESDIVVLLGIQSIPALAASILARLRRVPYVVISQTMLPRDERNRPSVILALKSIILGGAVSHVAQTPAAVATLREVYGVSDGAIHFAPFEAGAAEFERNLGPARDRESVRESLGVTRFQPVFMFVGSLFHLKGIDVLMRAFAKLGRDARLWIVGSGTEEARLRELATQLAISPHFFGRVEGVALAELYRAADVFVLPTRKDMWPKVLVEAAIAGLPLITTERCGAAGHVVRDGVNGSVVAVDDVEALAAAMRKMFDAEVRASMGAASRQIITAWRDPEREVIAVREALDTAAEEAVA